MTLFPFASARIGAALDRNPGVPLIRSAWKGALSVSVLLALLLLVAVSAAAHEVEVPTAPEEEEAPAAEERVIVLEPKRNPTLAGLLAVVVPGLGQFYTGQLTGGLYVLAASLYLFGELVGEMVAGREGSRRYTLAKWTYIGVNACAAVQAEHTAKAINARREKAINGQRRVTWRHRAQLPGSRCSSGSESPHASSPRGHHARIHEGSTCCAVPSHDAGSGGGGDGVPGRDSGGDAVQRPSLPGAPLSSLRRPRRRRA